MDFLCNGNVLQKWILEVRSKFLTNGCDSALSPNPLGGQHWSILQTVSNQHLCLDSSLLLGKHFLLIVGQDWINRSWSMFQILSSMAIGHIYFLKGEYQELENSFLWNGVLENYSVILWRMMVGRSILSQVWFDPLVAQCEQPVAGSDDIQHQNKAKAQSTFSIFLCHGTFEEGFMALLQASDCPPILSLWNESGNAQRIPFSSNWKLCGCQSRRANSSGWCSLQVQRSQPTICLDGNHTEDRNCSQESGKWIERTFSTFCFLANMPAAGLVKGVCMHNTSLPMTCVHSWNFE